MKELLDDLERISIADATGYTLIDTCAFIHLFGHHEHVKKFVEQLQTEKIALTSFNAEELIHVDHHLDVKKEIRKFFKEKPPLKIVMVPVHPGNADAERTYVHDIDPDLLSVVPDPSDAVLFAVALQIKGDIVTRDKHHIYNQLGEQFANKHNIEVRNKI